MSKDLGILLRQIGVQQVRLWRKKGFQPVKFREWHRVTMEVEGKRFMKMMRGADLREDIWPSGTKPKETGAKAKKK